MEYKIISGNVVEIRRTFMNVRSDSPKKKRGVRIAGNTSARRIRLNEREAIKNLARLLNANVSQGWVLVSLKYDNEHLPVDYSALEASGKKFTRQFRDAFRKEYGRNPKFILVNANWNPEKDCPARLHHHIIVERCSLDMLAKVWKGGGIATEETDGREDHTALAVYLVKNVRGLEKGAARWHASRGNLEKPIYTEPERKQLELFAKDDADTLKFFGADARDDLQKIVTNSTIQLENGFAAFPEGDPLQKYVQSVKPLENYFDVAMHGTPTAVGFGTEETNMSPRLLASTIRHTGGWNGQNVRLLSCSTGKQSGDGYCFAEELANALGVTVKAPDDTLYIYPNGKLEVGKLNDGHMVDYKPNERGRKK